jgi:hypothetical protein
MLWIIAAAPMGAFVRASSRAMGSSGEGFAAVFGAAAQVARTVGAESLAGEALAGSVGPRSSPRRRRSLGQGGAGTAPIH